MKGIRYTKYNGDLASEIDLEGLLEALSDYFLDSGFRDPYADFQEYGDDLDDLREALRRILESGEFFDESIQQQINQMAAEGKLDELIDKLLQRLEQQSYISSSQDQNQANAGGGHVGDAEGEVRFEVTDKSLDFLGYKALRDLLGPLGKSNFGRHDTRHWATGVEANGASKLYEFGDTLNLDITATLSARAHRRARALACR